MPSLAHCVTAGLAPTAQRRIAVRQLQDGSASLSHPRYIVGWEIVALTSHPSIRHPNDSSLGPRSLPPIIAIRHSAHILSRHTTVKLLASDDNDNTFQGSQTPTHIVSPQCRVRQPAALQTHVHASAASIQPLEALCVSRT